LSANARPTAAAEPGPTGHGGAAPPAGDHRRARRSPERVTLTERETRDIVEFDKIRSSKIRQQTHPDKQTSLIMMRIESIEA
jgi:hypothetical protein